MGRMVSAGTCAMISAIAATDAGCEKAPQARIAAAVAVEDVREAAGPRGPADLGAGCAADPVRELDGRAWSGRAAAPRVPLSDDRRSLYALDDHHRLSLWRDGSSEHGFQLRALAIGEDGMPVGHEVVLSNGPLVGVPVARSAEARGVTVWFLEDTDTANEPRRLATTVHCGP